MKFLKLSQINVQIAREIELLLSAEEDQSFQNLSAIAFDNFIDNSNFYARNLHKNKLCEASDHIVNLPSLKRAWYREQGLGAKESTMDFCLDLIKQVKPSIIYDQAQLFKGQTVELKQQHPYLKAIVTWDCYSKSTADGSLGYDLYFTCLESIRASYERNNHKCYINPFGFEKSILDAIPTKSERLNKICFTGSLVSNVHKNRFEVLNYLRGLGILDWWIGNLGKGVFTKSKLREIAYGNFSALQKNIPFEIKNRGRVFGREMFKILADYTISINVHGDGLSEIGNMRLIEASGMGSCQIIDWKANAEHYFEPDTEAVYFKSIDELKEKVDYLIANPEVAKSIGQKGQERTLKEHSMENHVLRMWEAIQKNI